MLQDRIREGLLRKAGLSQGQIDEAITAERETGMGLDQVLVSRNILPEAKCLQFFGEFLGMEFKPSLQRIAAPSDFIHKVPVQFARTHGLIAIGAREGVMQVATSKPLDVQPMDDLATMLRCEVEAVLTPRSEVAGLINRAYRHKADGVDEALADVAEDGDISGLANEIDDSEDVLDVSNKAPIIS